MATRAHRSAQDVFRQHAQAMVAGDLEAIVSDYAEDALFITHAGVPRGKDGVREAFRKLFADLPEPRFDVHTRILQGDVLFLEWTASGTGRVPRTASRRSSSGTGRSSSDGHYTARPA